MYECRLGESWIGELGWWIHKNFPTLWLPQFLPYRRLEFSREVKCFLGLYMYEWMHDRVDAWTYVFAAITNLQFLIFDFFSFFHQMRYYDNYTNCQTCKSSQPSSISSTWPIDDIPIIKVYGKHHYWVQTFFSRLSSCLGLLAPSLLVHYRHPLLRSAQSHFLQPFEFHFC